MIILVTDEKGHAYIIVVPDVKMDEVQELAKGMLVSLRPQV